MKYPDRYEGGSFETFQARVIRYLHPGIAVLDVGAGRRPVVPPQLRPERCFYGGLDISAEEFQQAPPGSYSGTWVRDVRHFEPELSGRFDVLVSFQVLEHVQQLDQVFSQMRSYLKPSGILLVQLSGRFAAFALLNQVLPHGISRWLLKHLLGRSPGSVFPAYYHRCWYSALCRLSAGWNEFSVVPIYTGGGYFRFSSILLRLYLMYEQWSMGSPNLATHYRIEAKL